MSEARGINADYEVVILGGGYSGLMSGLRLSAWTCPLSALLISDSEFFIERVRLQESLARPIEPRLPPLKEWLANTKLNFLQARVISLDSAAGSVTIQTAEGSDVIRFERCIYALGSRTDVEEVPGAAKYAFRLDPGHDAHSAAALRKRLRSLDQGARVVVVGGGNTAVEAAGEIKAGRSDLVVTLVAAGMAGDFNNGAKIARAVRSQLAVQGVVLVDDQPIREVKSGMVLTARGHLLPADLCVWAAGLRSPYIARRAGMAVDEMNRIWVDGWLRSTSHPRVLAVGDAARPIVATGAIYRPSAFSSLTSGAYAAGSLLKEARGKPFRPFSFSAFGQGVAVGRVGVGFATFPDDGEGYFVLTGRLALQVRNLFVRALVWFLRIERAWPGLSPFWLGRRRAAWHANFPRKGPKRPSGAASEPARAWTMSHSDPSGKM
jgi:NADH dehydrogenase